MNIRDFFSQFRLFSFIFVEFFFYVCRRLWITECTSLSMRLKIQHTTPHKLTDSICHKKCLRKTTHMKKDCKTFAFCVSSDKFIVAIIRSQYLYLHSDCIGWADEWVPTIDISSFSINIQLPNDVWGEILQIDSSKNLVEIYQKYIK